MNKTLRKFSKDAKALSPVVASIILIAVTVAVSIAVAAWMGGMTLGFMNTEQLKITNVAFTGVALDPTVEISMQNTGSNPVTISEIYVASDKTAADAITWLPLMTDSKLPANTGATATVDFDWVNGATYQIKVVTSQGNSFTYQGNAPST